MLYARDTTSSYIRLSILQETYEYAHCSSISKSGKLKAEVHQQRNRSGGSPVAHLKNLELHQSIQTTRKKAEQTDKKINDSSCIHSRGEDTEQTPAAETEETN